MANNYSALKRIRQTKKRTEANRRNITRTRTQVKRLQKAISGNDSEATGKLVPVTASTLDKAVQKGILTKNGAARLKSRLTRRANAVGK
jgi:small subunit ribosomal protein S20